MDAKIELLCVISCCLQSPSEYKCVECPFYEVDNCKDVLLKRLEILIK